MDKHVKFQQLYTKFVNGSHWLNERIAEGKVTNQDSGEFQRLVVEPMEDVWMTFTDDEKAGWDQVKMVVQLFDGTIVDEGQWKKHKTKGVKRWRKSFR